MVSKNKIIHLILWLKESNNIKERTLINVLCFFIGIITSLLAILLKTIVHYTSQFVKSIVNIESSNIFFFLTPLIGIALAVLFVRFFIKDSLAHGITKVLFAISKRKSNIASHNNYSSIVASTLTVGFGGSVGLEAPVVLTGSSIGSTLGRLFNFNYKVKTLLLGCGAAAAIASMFKAPIAGTIFALEVLMLDLSISSIIPLLISAVSASLLSTLLLGQNVVFNFVVFEPFMLKNTHFYLLLGLFCGVIGLYFTMVLEFIEAKFSNKIKNPLTKVIVGGILLGILIYFIPPLYGEGYEILSFIFNHKTQHILIYSYFYQYADQFVFVAIFLMLVIIFKAVASALTTGSGGVGGVFGPSLFLGGIAGFLFSGIINHFNIGVLSQRNFTLVGMAGVLSAVMQSPLTAIFLIAEITGGYELFVPIIITSMIAYITIHRFETFSVYTKRLAKQNELITHDKDKAILTLIKMRELIENDFNKISYSAMLGDLITEIANSKRNIFVVIDDDNSFKGLIYLDDIRKIIFNTNLYNSVSIKSLIQQPKDFIYTTDSPQKVMLKFKKTKAWNLPVIENGKYIGFLSRSKIMTSYHDLLLELSYNVNENN